MSVVPPIAVVGGSLAGLSAVQALVESPAVSAITVFGAEAHLPYDRPPLSKEILRGTWEAERCDLETVDDGRVTWRIGTPVTGLELGGPRLRLPDGSVQEFPGGIVIATGAGPRTIPGVDLGGVHTLRTIDDAIALRKDLESERGPVVIVGGGFIGAEVAAVCTERGLDVTILETLNHPFERVLGPEVGHAVMVDQLARGVQLHTGIAVSGLRGHGRVEAVELADGTLVDAVTVVLALGVEPSIQWLEDSGLSLGNGVMCDSTLLAAPRIVAAGDVACWPNIRFGEFRRVEHWDNAIRQGRHAALRLLAEHGHGEIKDFSTVPWVWSDQADNKLQIVGSTFDFDEVVIAHGSLTEGRFVALYRRADHLAAAAGFNQTKLITRYRRLLTQPVSWAEALATVESTAGLSGTRS